MTPAVRPRHAKGAVVFLAVACAIVPVSGGHAADDAGAFFREQFGFGSEPAPAAPQYMEPQYGDFDTGRPVTVRRKPRVVHKAAKPVAIKIAVGPVPPVSIYQDKTLRRGDAVMTKTGMKVFIGEHSAPFTDADFATLADADGLSKSVTKELTALNKVPRG